MGKVESIIKLEIVRLARREMKKVTVPLGKDVRAMKSTLSRLRKTVQGLERAAVRQLKAGAPEPEELQLSPEETKGSRFSPRLIRILRSRLGLTQRELAKLTGVTVGAIYQWETGKFVPRGDKKGILIALRKMGRRGVRSLLEGKSEALPEKKEKKSEEKPPARARRGRNPSKRGRRRAK